MPELRNIEFFNDPEGGVMIRDNEGVRTYQPEDKELTRALFTRIEIEYPKAFKALTEIYHKSRANVNYYRYLVCHRFIRCNFGSLDKKQDIDGTGRFTFEEVSCPIKGECKYSGVICGAEFDTRLTARQQEVMKLYCKGLEPEEIAEQLYISPETVKTTKRDAFRKAGVHDIREFMAKYKDVL
ncbi:helix-turn-helix transcriptional regulator [uncultured Alistipes sp.]|nr:helix-turn-helix transcriptional regulator [uncultured Alistipes sp.]